MTHLRTALASAAIALALAACGANGSPTPSPGYGGTNVSATARAAGRVTLEVRLRIVVTAPRGARPQYVSPGTKSLIYVVTQAGAAVPGGSGYVNLTPSSPQCNPTAPISPLTCTVTIPLQVTGSGTYDFALATYDAQQSGSASTAPCTPPATTGCAGNLLSQDLESYALVEGQINTVAFTLGGIPASIKIAPVNPGYLTGGGSGSSFALTLYGPQTQSAAIDVLDADGNVIVGPGKPTVAVASADTSKLLVVPASVTSNVYGLRAVTSGQPPVVTPGSVGLTVTATPVASSGGTALAVDGTVDVQHKILYVTTQGGSGTVLEYFDDNGRWSVRLDLSHLIWPLPLGGIATAGTSPTAFVAQPYHLASCPPGANDGRLCRNVAGGLFAPLGVTVDAKLNVYVAQGTGSVLECAPASATRYACKTAAHFFPLDDAGVAVDGARTLYVAKPISSRVVACPASAATLRTCSTRWLVHNAYGVALSTGGRAFVTSPHSSKVYACSTSAACTAAFSVNDAAAIAADASGTAYVVDQQHDRIYACAAACSEIVSLSKEHLHARWIAVVPAP